MPAAKRPAKDGKTFSITELSQEFDVTPRAIRFYEDMGLLEPARRGQTRIYDHRDRTRLKLTLRGKRLGLSLSEVKQLVDMYESPSDNRQQLEVLLGMLQAHREQLGRQLEDLRLTLAEIDQHELRCRRLLAEAADAGAGAASRSPVPEPRRRKPASPAAKTLSKTAAKAAA